MSIFNPEYREFSESGFEVKKFSLEMEKKLIKALDQNKETFPDIIQCPNKSCGVPVKVEMHENFVRVYCTNCGWENVVNKKKNST